MTKIFNQTTSKHHRRDLRNHSTAPEQLIWRLVRNRQIAGFKFRRQFSIGCYIVDFYCPAAQLVIEIDGDSHFTAEGQRYDQEREAYFKSLQLRIVRFTNQEVTSNLPAVATSIKAILLTSPPPSPS